MPLFRRRAPNPSPAPATAEDVQQFLTKPPGRKLSRALKGIAVLILIWAVAMATDRMPLHWFGEHVLDQDHVAIFNTVAPFHSESLCKDPSSNFTIALNAWVYNLRVAGLFGKLINWGHAESLGIRSREDLEMFGARTRLFFTDNQRGKQLRVEVCGHQVQVLNRTKPDGHISTVVTVPCSVLSCLSPTRWLTITTTSRDGRNFTGGVQLVEPVGLSVISDIDDTIKITNVSNKREVMINTFVRRFRAVEHMADSYNAWQRDHNATFHYVSGSPYQLYSSVNEFISEFGFPPGTFDLRRIRWKDSSFLELLRPPRNKHGAIVSLISIFPNRTFVLVGDTSEKDPEIYGQIARDYPKSIVGIFIRDVAHSYGTSSAEATASLRFRLAFADVPAHICYVFTDPRALPDELTRMLAPQEAAEAAATAAGRPPGSDIGPPTDEQKEAASAAGVAFATADGEAPEDGDADQ